MKNLKLYIFKNIMGNHCDGDYYFIAEDLDEAKKQANVFSFSHNASLNNNPNYTIEWDEEDITEIEIKKGPLLINRVYIPVSI